MKPIKSFGVDDKPLEALKAIRKWIQETHDDSDASDSDRPDMLMCPACGHVRSVFETDDGESKCIKCGEAFKKQIV
ncbi:MAG: hypothetical protein R3236_02220 [Phycisphaeraceae bacterium]|nr:hypothetical protein [Phycisphaeraceae bacterium]